MPVTQIFSFPDIIPDTSNWGIVYNTRIFTSPLSGAIQTLEMPGARWQASLVFNNMLPEESRKLMAFLVKLRGSSGRFYLYDHSIDNPRGSPSAQSGGAKVDGPNQTGSLLKTYNWTPNTNNLFLAGDYIKFGSSGQHELKMISSNVSSGPSGIAYLPIEPPIRISPINQDVIVYNKPTTIMMLVDDTQAQWDNSESVYLANITINCIEAFYYG